MLKQKNIKYNSITTNIYNEYVHAASSLDGICHKLTNGFNVESLRKLFDHMFGSTEETISSYSADVDDIFVETDVNNIRQSYKVNDVSGEIPSLSAKMKNVLKDAKFDPSIKTLLFDAVNNIIDSDVMILESSKIFGRVWRFLCGLRSDERRDLLIHKMEIAKNALNSKDREKIDLWFKELLATLG